MSRAPRVRSPAQLKHADFSLEEGLLIRYSQHAASMIRNVDTCMQVLDTSEVLLPMTINDGGAATDNSYVVSPSNTYSRYAAFEIHQLLPKILAHPIERLLAGVRYWFDKSRLDRTVHVNNWLLSTNLYPPGWQGDELASVTKILVSTYPSHAIVFRSINAFSNQTLLSRLLSMGYIALPSRQVYLFDAREGASSSFLQRKNNQIDTVLLNNTTYRWVSGADIVDEDYPRLEALYNLLYLEKYCPLNPQFPAEWLKQGQQDGWLQLSALRNIDGRIDAVLGWVSNQDVMTAPIVGYDTSLQQRLGLYRLITQRCLQEAARRRTLLNFSSGAAHFKRLRGGVAEMEYSLVYIKHLPSWRKIPWQFLNIILNTIGLAVMRKFKL